MTKLPIPPCWTRAEIQIAAQVDAGSLEFDDPASDAVFQAVHQSVPLARVDKAKGTLPVTEDHVLQDLCQPLASNEPHIRFIRGRVGAGKSHLVRWLRSRIPQRDNWHVVYIEKRNTSLRRIIEVILAGIQTPAIESLHTSLAQAASRVTSVQEAMLALLNQLHRLVEFDDVATIDTMTGADLDDIRQFAARLIGDFTFKEQLSLPGGPLERIAKLARDGHAAGVDVNAEDLHIREADLRVRPEAFIDVGETFQRRIAQLISNPSLRNAVAAVIDHYVPQATREVFAGSSTDLLQVFDDVRSELARRGQELFLFVEDLVLLHGIDAQLAQALTVPARRDLCPIRAAIAVTSGYLDDRYATFSERGVHYTMDVERQQVGAAELRSFVGRYLNAGRVGRSALAVAAASGESPPNKCTDCPHRDQCHPAFGTTNEGHGLFPFNGMAVDRLIKLASPAAFDPRNILREVVRAPLEVAEAELVQPGLFPSDRFAATGMPTRVAVPVEVRDAIAKSSGTADAEISLRAFYAANPPAVDDELRQIAEIFGVELTELGKDVPVEVMDTAPSPQQAAPHEIDRWVAGERLKGSTARIIRNWILDRLTASLQTGPHGLNVKRIRSAVQVAALKIFASNVILDNAAGGGGFAPEGPTIRFSCNDSDGVLLKGVLAAIAGDLAGPNAGRWYFDMHRRLAVLEADIRKRAAQGTKTGSRQALAVLGVLSSVDERPVNSPQDALAVMIRPRRPDDINPAIVRFLTSVDKHRTSALIQLRDSLTQRKGDGAPSIFDAGAVLPHLVSSARLTQLPASLRDGTSLGVDLGKFHEAQRAASQSLWSPVRVALEQIRQHVSDDEDLNATAAIMDRYVEQAHRAAALTKPDAKEAYRRLRERINDAQLSALRHLAKAAQSTADAASIWVLTHDPTSMLDDAQRYWRMCDSLLESLRDTVATPTGVQAYDRARLQRAFRALADILEEVAKG